MSFVVQVSCSKDRKIKPTHLIKRFRGSLEPPFSYLTPLKTKLVVTMKLLHQSIALILFASVSIISAERFSCEELRVLWDIGGVHDFGSECRCTDLVGQITDLDCEINRLCDPIGVDCDICDEAKKLMLEANNKLGPFGDTCECKTAEASLKCEFLSETLSTPTTTSAGQLTGIAPVIVLVIAGIVGLF